MTLVVENSKRAFTEGNRVLPAPRFPCCLATARDDIGAGEEGDSMRSVCPSVLTRPRPIAVIPGLELCATSATPKLQSARTFLRLSAISILGGTKMPCRGVHFAITSDQLGSVLAASNDDDLMKVIERIETGWDEENLAESDKAWDAIHRCLTDDVSGEGSDGEYPLNHVICGGRPLHRGEEYIVSLVTPEQVREVSTAIDPVAEHWMRERYFSLLKPDRHDGEVNEADFQYTWTWFENIRDLYRKAAGSGRAVIFTVDQ